jgi:hypothetical protein
MTSEMLSNEERKYSVQKQETLQKRRKTLPPGTYMDRDLLTDIFIEKCQSKTKKAVFKHLKVSFETCFT